MGLKYNFYLTVLILGCFLIIGTCKNLSASNLASVPQERIAPDGQYDQSGLAKRLIKALEEDEILSALMTEKNIYVAQSGTKIILRGTTSDDYTMMRVVNIARNIKGISEIDINQVKIQ